MAKKPFAFVLMPFEDAFADIYKLGIQAAATECEVIAERVDEQIYSETMLERIYRQIDSADFIIADMTGRNPNVFYEVGYTHARGKLCTLLTQSAQDIPFDLSHHRHIVYGHSIRKLKEKLIPEINWLKIQLEKQQTSAFTIDLKSATGELIKTEWSAKSTVELVFDIHNKTSRKSPDIEAIYLYTKDKWKFRQGTEDCASAKTEIKNQLRHFIKTPVPRLSPGAWAQVKIEGERQVWAKWSSDEYKEKYTHAGNLTLEIFTSEGAFREDVHVSIEVEELPF